MSFVKIYVLGHVGSAPEIRKLANGSVVANFSLATNEKFMAKGEQKEITHWWRVDAWQKGDNGLVTGVIQKFVDKGTQLMIEGTPVQEEWTDKSTGTVRNGLKIRIGHPGTSLQLCGGRNGHRPAADNGEAAPAPDMSDFDSANPDKIPF
jgi:single-strand DNA-binding protein